MGLRDKKMNNEHKSESSTTGQFLRFCWLRETAPGHLEHDGGIRIAKCDLLEALFGIHPAQKRTPAEPPVSVDEILATLSVAGPFDSFPQWARRRLANILGPLASEGQRREAARNAAVLMDVANRILAVAPHDVEAEVHLPYISRRHWVSRFDVLANTEFVFREGRVVPKALLSPEHRDEYNAQLIAAASISPAFDVVHSFTHVQSVAPGLLAAFLPVESVPEPLSGDSGHEISIHTTLASSACRAWNSAPVEKGGAYFPIHAAVSVAIQNSLRRWLAWHWLSDLNNYDDTLAAFTVLAYVCSQPFPGRRRTDFTYDTLTTDWMYFAFRCARRPLRTLLKIVRTRLIAAGKPELAQAYHPEEAKFILQRVRKQRKSIQALIATEGDIVNFILRFGLQLQAGNDAIAAVREAPEFVRGLASRLRRLFREQDLTWMGPMLLLEATNALSMALGAGSAIRTAVSASPSPAATFTPYPVPQQSQPVPCEW
jgi:hypothetical protein